MTAPETDPATGLPIGPRVVNPSPAPRPQRTTLAGRHVTITPLDPVAHADSLYATTSDLTNERLWLYLFDGPFRDRPAFDDDLREKAALKDPLFFAVVDKGSQRAVGYAAYLAWHRRTGALRWAPFCSHRPCSVRAAPQKPCT